MSTIEVIATSTFGLESVVKQEIVDLGYDNVQVENGKITVATEMRAIPRLNIHLRSADRVKWKIGEWKAESFEELFEATKAIAWEDILPENACFPVVGKSVKSTLYSVPDCQAIVKKAIVDRLKQTYKREWFAEDGPTYRIEVALLKDVVTLSIDTSGDGLHKRGYRRLHNEAPMKETMAAGLIQLSRWRSDTPFIDPFCGSGTFPIEAALIGRNIAPGFNRSFVAEEWDVLPQQLWNDAREEAEDVIQRDGRLSIRGSDIDRDAVQLSRHNAKLAGVETDITFARQDVSRLKTPETYGKIICNPPYGQRMSEKKQVEALYKQMGNVFSELKTWSVYVFSAHPEFEKHYGKRATKRRKLYSGNVRCDYYQYFGPRPPKR